MPRGDTHCERWFPVQQETTPAFRRAGTRVTVLEPMLPGDAPAEQEGGEPAVAVGPGIGRRKSEIPAVYGTERSPLEYEVPKSGGVINVELKSAPGR